MQKDKLKDFLDGKLDFEALHKATDEDSIESDFIESYHKVIKENKTKVPDFNPFGRIELAKKRRISLVRKIIPFAASILLVISLFFMIGKRNTTKDTIALSDLELIELQQNTEQALFHFSKELNACIAEIDKEQKTRQPFAELYSINHFKIDFDNPTKNLKIN
ncbi:MAG: hypothetical protein HN778_06475 [Prolixibacteraceae bacterium]|jgi:hypothetical protein|nr:hypothetical protein [Prolixibacteraceae bacterium]MBT6005010.1 hypothetical protein [Prolixibacteraceae bacterium]MBT6764880.1 hypothetical protein [Prolixibacteraceae bacterium]MBT6999040.1 hypothetical protein [Prolixibacteraceae bacterium]MBT7394461.1 hypothetical protein [Prolixibacteraceae bacterium]